MHTNEACGGRRLCAWVEIEMHFTGVHSNKMARQGQGHGRQRAMLSEAHHLVAFKSAGAGWGTPLVVAAEAKESHF